MTILNVKIWVYAKLAAAAAVDATATTLGWVWHCQGSITLEFKSLSSTFSSSLCRQQCQLDTHITHNFEFIMFSANLICWLLHEEMSFDQNDIQKCVECSCDNDRTWNFSLNILNKHVCKQSFHF